MKNKFDFSGWVTKNDLLCADGRTIRRDAFKDNDGGIVPLVWQHQHDSPANVLGHMLLENRDSGVYGYGSFNKTDLGQYAKLLVQHGDICSMSIYANQLKQTNRGDVLHGSIKEVSLVLAGANPGAMIDFPVLSHGEQSETEAYIYVGEDCNMRYRDLISHADEEYEDEEYEDEEYEDEDDADDDEETVQDVFDSMNEKQKNVVYYMLAEAAGEVPEDDENGEEDYEDGDDYEYEEDADDYDEGDDDEMKHNVFDADRENPDEVLSHSEIKAILDDGKMYGSLKESFLAHAGEDVVATYGIEEIGELFPNYKNYTTTPEFIKRDMGWVATVMNGVHHTPFSRIKSLFADITEDEARAKGYIKGNVKTYEVFGLLKRTTDPQTVYKKQKLDRDDIVDITDFDVVAWLKSEMRMMLDEEIARAILIGDDRLDNSDDKISQNHIRSIWMDDPLYAFKVPVAAVQGEARAKTMIKTVLRSWKDYKGSGNCTMYTTEDMLTEMLLLEDGFGHFLYPNKGVLATTLRVKDIVTVPPMAEIVHNRVDSKTNKEYKPLAIVVNLADYNVGADKGGSINMFDDFDIDYNQQKYLIETRCSGALVKPKSAIVLEEEQVQEQEGDDEEGGSTPNPA